MARLSLFDKIKGYGMKKLLSTLFWVLIIGYAYGQFGVNFKYNNHETLEEEQGLVFTERGDVPINLRVGDGFNFGIDYWFRLPQKRIEFLPELNFGDYRSTGLNYELHHQFYSFFFNTNIYLLDLASDCDCPTFSKENDFFKKGLFLNVSPGITYSQHKLTVFESQMDAVNDFQFSIGVALGLDIGLSDLLTISPMIGMRHYPDVFVGGFNALEFNSPLTQLNAGIRLGFRFDEQ